MLLSVADPVNSAIFNIQLTDHRTADEWKEYLNRLVANSFFPR